MRIKNGYEAPLAASSLAAVAATGEPRVLDDLDQYLKQHPDSKSTRLAVAEGIRSSLTCPVRVNGLTVGFLFFSSAHPDTYAGLNHQGLIGLTAMLSAVVAEDLQVRATDELARQLQEQAMRDPLTGLLNRRGLETAFRAGSHPDSPSHALILIDLDKFKLVNDTNGHAAGDQFLRDVAKTMTNAIRHADRCARVGGDEFVIVLADTAGVSRVTKQVLENIAALGVGVTASIGYTTYDSARPDFAQVLAAADAAMYQAKTGGGNRAIEA